MTTNIAASVRARLLNLAKAEGSDFNGVLIRYTLERLLYRLSLSSHADRFLLKGALLFAIWYDMPHRPTRDADLLGFGSSELHLIQKMFQEIASIAVDDGIEFDANHIQVAEIRKDAGYRGARVTIPATLANARSNAHIDIGFGDAVTPEPVQATYPVLLPDLPAPHLKTYPVYTVIAEKLHAIVLLGMTNSRLKDYLDLSILVQREELDQEILARAIQATFQRRSTPLPAHVPIGLSDEFGHDITRQNLWNAFLKKNDITITPLQNVVTMLRLKLMPVLIRAPESQ